MPTYEYSCEACGHEFEREQRITEAAIKECPKCGKDKARRMITQGNFILKGGGWYSDLYSGSSNKKSSDSSGGSETKTSTSTESAGDAPSKPPKAESKPAAAE